MAARFACHRGALLLVECGLEISLSFFRLRNKVLRRMDGCALAARQRASFASRKAAFRRHHFWMLVLVTQGKGSDMGLEIQGDVATRLASQRRAGNARDRDQHIDVVGHFFDLLKLTFQTRKICQFLPPSDLLLRSL